MASSVRELERLIQDYPKSEWAVKAALKSADYWISQGDSDKAKAALLKVVNSANEMADKALAEKKIGEILRAQGHLKEATIYLTEASKKAQGDLACEIQYQLAEMDELEGDKEKAAKEFSRAGELFPTAPYASRAKLRAVELKEALEKGK